MAASKKKELMRVGKSSQAKGRRAEIELSKILQSHGYDVRPGEPLNYGSEPDLVGLENIHIEVKRCESLRLSEWMQQSERDSARFQDGAPTLFYRRSREPWRVVMNLPDWLAIYQRHQCQCGGSCKHHEE